MYQIKYEDETFAVWLEPETTIGTLCPELRYYRFRPFANPLFHSSYIGAT